MFSRSFLPSHATVDISHRCPVAMQLIETSFILKIKTLWIQLKKKKEKKEESRNKRPYPEGECTYEKTKSLVSKDVKIKVAIIYLLIFKKTSDHFNVRSYTVVAEISPSYI